MRAAGLVVGETLELLREAVAPGVTTAELDALAEEHIREPRGDVPSFLGYHGVPGDDLRLGQRRDRPRHPGRRVLARGRPVSIDCGAIVDGWHGDAAITVPVGEVARRGRPSCSRVDRGRAVARASRPPRVGGRLTDIGARGRGRRSRAAGRLRHRRGVRRARHRHRDAHGPARPQLRPPGPRPRAGRGHGARGRADGQPRAAGTPGCSTTAGPSSPQDGSRSAHFEHTFALTAGRPLGAHRARRRRRAAGRRSALERPRWLRGAAQRGPLTCAFPTGRCLP